MVLPGIQMDVEESANECSSGANITDQNIENKFKRFVEEFVTIAESKKSVYNVEARLKGTVSPTQKSDIAEAVGGAIGMGAGGLVSLLGVPPPVAISGGALLGSKAAKEIFNFVFCRFHRAKAKTITQCFRSLEKLQLRKIFACAAAEIFRVFEFQFKNLSHEDLKRIANDAVKAMFVYINEENTKSDDVLLRALAKSITIPKPKHKIHKGHKLKNDSEWKTISLFTKVGIYDLANESYYSSKTSKPEKYGFRLLFAGETVPGELSTFKSTHHDRYKYVLTEGSINKYTQDVIQKINEDDPEETAKKIESEVVLLNDAVQSVGAKLDEHTELIAAQHGELERIKDSVSDCLVGQGYTVARVQDLEKDLNRVKEESISDNETVEKILEFGKRNIQKSLEHQYKICEMGDKVERTRNIVENNGSISDELRIFNVSRPAQNFTNRDNVLSDIKNGLLYSADCIGSSRAVCIVGSEGVGKSQIAKKYAFDNFFTDNAIWIDSTSNNSMKNSIHEAAKDLTIPTEEIVHSAAEERDIADIARDIYTLLPYQTTLFIFDNASSYDMIMGILPWTLLPGKTSSKIIITSRNTDWDIGPICDIYIIPLMRYARDEAIQFVRESLKAAPMPEDCDDNIMAMVEMLNNSPSHLQAAVDHIIKKRKELKRRNGKTYSIEDFIKGHQNGTVLLNGYNT